MREKKQKEKEEEKGNRRERIMSRLGQTRKWHKVGTSLDLVTMICFPCKGTFVLRDDNHWTTKSITYIYTTRNRWTRIHWRRHIISDRSRNRRMGHMYACRNWWKGTSTNRMVWKCMYTKQIEPIKVVYLHHTRHRMRSSRTQRSCSCLSQIQHLLYGQLAHSYFITLTTPVGRDYRKTHHAVRLYCTNRGGAQLPRQYGTRLVYRKRGLARGKKYERWVRPRAR